MNYDDGDATAVDSGEDIGGLVGEDSLIESMGDGWELCEIFLDSHDLRKLGVPRGTEAVVFRIEKGVILVSPAR
jgi:hypothetical protein